MPDDPLDPFKEARKRNRLLDEALGGTARRFFEEEKKRRKLLDDALGGTAQRFFDEEQKRRKLFDQSALGKAAQGIIDAQRTQERFLDPFKNSAIQQYLDAEQARWKAFDVGSLASAKAFQTNIASAMADLVEPYTKLSKQMAQLGAFDRIAEQQSALIKASTGINSQIEAIGRAMRDAIPTGQISASLGAQSALADQMRRISEQFSQLDRIAISGGVTESAVWEAMRDTYGLSAEMSVSQAFLEIGEKLDQPREEGKSFGLKEAWQLIQFLWFVYGVYAMIAGLGDYTEEDRARDQATTEAVQRIEVRQHMQEVEGAIAKASALAEIARINELPRAYVTHGANVRRSPEQNADRVARLGPNTMLAVEEKKGRWLRVIYADALTQEVAEGWVWGGSVELPSRR